MRRSPESLLLSERQRVFLEKYVARLQPQPGARELLECLKERGLARVAATSAKREELEAILEAGTIADQIDAATTSDDVDRSKPDPDIMQSALKKASIGPHEAIYLGDTPYDVSASNKAQIPIIALTCGGWNDEDLESAAEIYANPADLLERIGESLIAKQ